MLSRSKLCNCDLIGTIKPNIFFVAKARGVIIYIMMKYRAFRSTIAESFCKSLPIQHANVKERFQYYKRQDICLLFILVLYDTIDRYIFNLKAGKKMKCATWANGRRATHEQRKQKDLNELPPQFTQIFSFQYT